MGQEDGYDDPRRRQMWKKTGILAGIAVVLMLVIGLSVGLAGKKSGTTPESDGVIRHDCHPDQGKPEHEMKANCEDRGCNWRPDQSPKCSYPDDYVNYVVESAFLESDTHIVFRLAKTERASGFDKDVKKVIVDVQGKTDDVVRVKIYDDNNERWEVPMPVLKFDTKKIESPKYNITVEKNDLIISRLSTGKVIFQTRLTKLIFANQFIQLSVNVSSESLYGFGERQAPHQKSVASLAKNEHISYTFLNHDGVKGISSYGSHPFYLMYEEQNKDEAHGVLLLNSNAMDVLFTKEPALTYRAIGGILDFYIFLGPTATDVIRQKASAIGHTPMPPYWSLGFHLCRWGYKNTSHVREVFQANTELGIPIETQWVDIDYMDDNINDFTVNANTFGDLHEFVDYLHSINRRFIPILDPSLGWNETDPIPEFLSGIEKNVFVRHDDGDLLVTRVWNPLSVIPDFTHPNASSWWKESLTNLYGKIKYDGMWIDMNEPAATDGRHGSIRGCTNNSLDNPQYNPMHPLPIWNHSICFSALHDIGYHYDVHNMMGLYEGKLTYESLLEVIPNKRPFVLSRATTTGQNLYTNHWLGDNFATWDDLRASIPNSLDFNLFGIPMVGPDICGFNDNTTIELCARWQSLGAFYPFSRNHNSNDSNPQDPASLGDDVVQSARKALTKRYSLLPVLYTLFYENTVSGDPVLRSLKWNFPEDPETSKIETQFMWGDSVLINPVLTEGATKVDAYFPKGSWYNYPNGNSLSQGEGSHIELDIPLTEINVALRGGRIFPTIEWENATTHDHKSLTYTIIVALDEEGKGNGKLYADDGEAVDAALRDDAHSVIDFKAQNSQLSVQPVLKGYAITNDVSEVRVLGVKGKITKVLVVDVDGEKEAEFRQNGEQITVILPPGRKILSDFTVKWSHE